MPAQAPIAAARSSTALAPAHQVAGDRRREQRAPGDARHGDPDRGQMHERRRHRDHERREERRPGATDDRPEQEGEGEHGRGHAADARPLPQPRRRDDVAVGEDAHCTEPEDRQREEADGGEDHRQDRRNPRGLGSTGVRHRRVRHYLDSVGPASRVRSYSRCASRFSSVLRAPLRATQAPNQMVSSRANTNATIASGRGADRR